MHKEEPQTLPPAELERQLERGNLFLHTVLTEQIVRSNEHAALLLGLIDCLIQKGVVLPDELKAAVEAVQAESAAKGEVATLGVAIRVDSAESPEPSVMINCAERIHICQAVCCRLRFALSVEEIEAGLMKWDLGQPYYNRHHEHGYCHQINLETKRCTIYEQRPPVCRSYDCSQDPRIWRDFARMELNQAWIDAHLDREDLRLEDIWMISG